MNPISFCKFHGFGNDYIVFEAEALRGVSSLEDFAVKVCHRNTGIGGDGIAVLEKLDGNEADYSCRIINPDGSEAGFSGNGTRCAVAYLYYKNLWSAPKLRLQTKSGNKNYDFLNREENTFRFRAELGRPNFELPDNPLARMFKTASGFAGLALFKEGLAFDFFYVDVGNPVACIFVANFDGFENGPDKFSWQDIGRRIESFTEMFPDRTNVVFIKKVDAENIEIRIWERGAGETSSSGTCSIAAALAHLHAEKRRGAVQVHAVGGTTEAVWREDDEMMITGRADLAFCGQWFEEIKS
jgi:diaminopimelate epimerase